MTTFRLSHRLREACLPSIARAARHSPEFSRSAWVGGNPGYRQGDLPGTDEIFNHPWKGDFDAMADRHRNRALVAYSKIFYLLDGAMQRGTTDEPFREPYATPRHRREDR